VTLQLIVSREARSDLVEAAEFFRRISPRLAIRFGVELEGIYSSILAHPEMYPVVYKNFRRALLRRFPYSVFFIVEEPVLLVIGVVHQSRDESTWKRRA
jgi:plasmid stabilization system protein ParE